MVMWVKCLLCIFEELSSESQHLCKSQVVRASIILGHTQMSTYTHYARKEKEKNQKGRHLIAYNCGFQPSQCCDTLTEFLTLW